VYCGGATASTTFPKVQNIETPDACAILCSDEPGCTYFTVYDFGGGYGACNLFIPSNPSPSYGLAASSTCTYGSSANGGAPTTGFYQLCSSCSSCVATGNPPSCVGYSAPPIGPNVQSYSVISSGTTQTCADPTCRKDLYAGTYVYCSITTSFTPIQNIATPQECANQCSAEPGCTYFTVYNNGACNLFIPSKPAANYGLQASETCTYGSTPNGGVPTAGFYKLNGHVDCQSSGSPSSCILANDAIVASNDLASATGSGAVLPRISPLWELLLCLLLSLLLMKC